MLPRTRASAQPVYGSRRRRGNSAIIDLTFNEREVAEIDTSKSLLRKRLKHFLKRPPGIAFADAHLEIARMHAVVTVFVLHTETGDSYGAPLEYFARFGRAIGYGEHGSQTALPLEYWSRNGSPPTALVLVPTPEPPDDQSPKQTQLSLL